MAQRKKVPPTSMLPLQFMVEPVITALPEKFFSGVVLAARELHSKLFFFRLFRVFRG
ncbi:MAG: hypothetical protein PHI96_09285 [Desulfovibrio sp.]|nr:hypothetical protein [Desulfovibrio sp.]